MGSRTGLESMETTTRRRDREGRERYFLHNLLPATFMIVALLVMPSTSVAHAARSIQVSKYFWNTYNSTQSAAISITNSGQITEIRFTTRPGGQRSWRSMSAPTIARLAQNTLWE